MALLHISVFTSINASIAFSYVYYWILYVKGYEACDWNCSLRFTGLLLWPNVTVRGFFRHGLHTVVMWLPLSLRLIFQKFDLSLLVSLLKSYQRILEYVVLLQVHYANVVIIGLFTVVNTCCLVDWGIIPNSYFRKELQIWLQSFRWCVRASKFKPEVWYGLWRLTLSTLSWTKNKTQES